MHFMECQQIGPKSDRIWNPPTSGQYSIQTFQKVQFGNQFSLSEEELTRAFSRIKVSFKRVRIRTMICEKVRNK